jgi:hypothetical protein
MRSLSTTHLSTLSFRVAMVSTALSQIAECCVPAGKPIFERCARQALRALWRMRTPLGLFGTSLDMMQGIWLDNNGGIGASADSFYEYLLKAYILFGACLAEHVHSYGLTKQATRPCALSSALQLSHCTLFLGVPNTDAFCGALMRYSHNTNGLRSCANCASILRPQCPCMDSASRASSLAAQSPILCTHWLQSCPANDGAHFEVQQSAPFMQVTRSTG